MKDWSFIQLDRVRVRVRVCQTRYLQHATYFEMNDAGKECMFCLFHLTRWIMIMPRGDPMPKTAIYVSIYLTPQTIWCHGVGAGLPMHNDAISSAVCN